MEQDRDGSGPDGGRLAIPGGEGSRPAPALRIPQSRVETPAATPSGLPRQSFAARRGAERQSLAQDDGRPGRGRGGRSMIRKAGARPPGQIRQSQVITTFGPGAMLDLPNHSVLIGGLEYWNGQSEEIPEPRLTAKLRTLLGVPASQLMAPPPDQEDPTAPQTG